ncbi:hypothetical protein DSM3645_26319 [Blastopirellula marina DSM 3645]|uniref:Uncharacterized protein n=1 Tax=Blastopirellula marina DSM 3645 TaxID=314230 RepID=A3ZWH7_9BACT|nr:hypothetical protein DSM3645_26319 [Blastopirellula marina DSM 3645]
MCGSNVLKEAGAGNKQRNEKREEF